MINDVIYKPQYILDWDKGIDKIIKKTILYVIKNRHLLLYKV